MGRRGILEIKKDWERAKDTKEEQIVLFKFKE